ncbi:MAG TPA: ribosome small subunit-dependent GTPase A [Chromatiales bacterium]|nr:ribosome small subunit-dependent GTPase A [Chromatiales bacterium]
MTPRREDPRLGLVIANFGRTAAVEDDAGNLYQCVVRKKAGTAVCGDRVRWTRQPGGHGAIIEILPRRSLLSRPGRHGKLKPLCANVEQLVIVCCPPSTGPLDTRLLDQYLVAAELTDTAAVIVVNKADLADDITKSRLRTQLKTYEAIGYPVVFTSARTGDGLARLRDRLRKCCSVLTGESGVGKSSLIKRLIPDLDIRIGALSAASGKGRHTTTTTTLYHLKDGGDIIDSPGVREFGLWHITAPELENGFREFKALKGRCKYRNCRHVGEDGCAIEAAVVEGLIDPARLDSYRAIMSVLCRYAP